MNVSSFYSIIILTLLLFTLLALFHTPSLSLHLSLFSYSNYLPPPSLNILKQAVEVKVKSSTLEKSVTDPDQCSCPTGTQTQCLSLTMQTLYHWATEPNSHHTNNLLLPLTYPGYTQYVKDHSNCDDTYECW